MNMNSVHTYSCVTPPPSLATRAADKVKAVARKIPKPSLPFTINVSIKRK